MKLTKNEIKLSGLETVPFSEIKVILIFLMTAFAAKSSSEEAYMIPREEFTSNPQSLFIPYFATSARLPPCAPTPGTSKKCSGHSNEELRNRKNRFQ